jgi:hypothetical protein
MRKEYGGPLLTEFQSRILKTVGAPCTVAAIRGRAAWRRHRFSSLDTSRPWSKIGIAFSVAWRRYRRIRLGSPPAPEEREHAALWPNQY